MAQVVVVKVSRVEGLVPVLVPVEEIESIEGGELSSYTRIKFKDGGSMFTLDSEQEVLRKLQFEKVEV